MSLLRAVSLPCLTILIQTHAKHDVPAFLRNACGSMLVRQRQHQSAWHCAFNRRSRSPCGTPCRNPFSAMTLSMYSASTIRCVQAGAVIPDIALGVRIRLPPFSSRHNGPSSADVQHEPLPWRQRITLLRSGPTSGGYQKHSSHDRVAVYSSVAALCQMPTGCGSSPARAGCSHRCSAADHP